MTKRYLKTYEEVIDALKAGKVIRDTDSLWTLRDGFIVRKRKDANYTSWVINDCISSNYSGIYVEEPDQLKLEVGKFYKTRDGRKAIVYAKMGIDCPYPFCVVKVGRLDAYNINEEGKQAADDLSLDLVAPWEEA